MSWLGTWAKRRRIDIDSSKIDQNLSDYPLLITLSSGVGKNDANTTDIFNELSVTSSGIIDSYTKLLLHPEGDVSTTGHGINSYGNPQIISTGPTGFDYSLYFDGTGDYFDMDDHVDWDFGADDFTIDFWINFDDTNNRNIFGQYTGTFSTSSVICQYWAGDLFWRICYGGTYLNASYTWTPTTGVWYHIACVRDGSTMRLFVNGTQEASETIGSNTANDSTTSFKIGNGYASDPLFKGYISEFRISKGIARWDSTFTPPSLPYTTSSGIDSNTKFLFHPEGDISANQHTITFNGDPEIVSSPAKFNKSYHLDGTGDYLNLPNNSDWDFGSGDFTIDFWVRFTSLAGIVQGFFVAQPSSGPNSYQFLYRISSYGTNNTLEVWPDDQSAGYQSVVWTPTLNTWYHIAFVKDGDIIRYFVDGVSKGTSDLTGKTFNTNGNIIAIGSTQSDAALYNFYGYMSEYRVSKGIARWTKNFNPPINSYPNYRDVISYSDKKIAITTSDGTTQCYTEIEEWNPYKEEAYLWTKVSGIDTGSDTYLYLYYDPLQADNTTYVGDIGSIPGRNAWSSAFKSVWHMAEIPITQITDSTSNNYHMTPNGMLANDLVEGNIDGALDFNGSDDNLSRATDSVFRYPGCVELLCKVRTRVNNGDAWEHDTAIQYGAVNWSMNFPGGSQKFRVYYYETGPTYHNLDSNSVINLNTYYYIVVNTTTSSTSIYIDGQHDKTDYSFSMFNHDANGRPLYIGGDSGYRYMDGIIDEIRISDDIRSTAYIKANHYNFQDDLISWGTPESPPTHFIDGYVKEYNLPVARTVRLYRRSDGQLMSSTTSQAGDGYYYLTSNCDDEHFVIAFDDDLGEDFNALIIDRAIPEEIV